MRHKTAWLGQYLVAGVEDPRLNLQSILSRHFLIRALAGETFRELLEEEYRFSAVMNWLVGSVQQSGGAEQLASVRHALQHGADNAEGLEIPRFVLQAFATLPVQAGYLTIPNYIDMFLRAGGSGTKAPAAGPPSLNCFQELWQGALERNTSQNARPSVVEAACGSANDYRFLASYGIARLIDYSGFDLCDRNIENAQALFPKVTFTIGNVFAIDAPDQAFELCLVQDLFEHLSLAGLDAAVKEVCRVTRCGICAGFFQMDEIAEPKVRPVDEYYCNLLSMAQTRELFARHGFEARVIHVDTFLRQQVGVGPAHNPNAYTFLLHRREGLQELGRQ